MEHHGRLTYRNHRQPANPAHVIFCGQAAVSPIPASLFLHYGFGVWIGRVFTVPFARYADQPICRCRGEREALALRRVLDRRFAECGLALRREKTKVVYRNTGSPHGLGA
jgi:RNA-directed DNA polymerase